MTYKDKNLHFYSAEQIELPESYEDLEKNRYYIKVAQNNIFETTFSQTLSAGSPCFQGPYIHPI